jgi:hypothetical protein
MMAPTQPAVKLLDFFRFTSEVDVSISQGAKVAGELGGLATFSTDKVQAISQTMRSLSEVGRADAQRWVKYWKGVGFI